MRMREARTKFIHQLSCGLAFHFSQIHIDTPPVRMMYSPFADGTVSARKGAAASVKQAQKSRQMERMARGKCPLFSNSPSGNLAIPRRCHSSEAKSLRGRPLANLAP